MRHPSRSVACHLWLRLVSLSLVGPAAAQTTWFVDAAGSPPGSGTSSDPYTSIQFALDQNATLDGDTLLVLPGVYAESLDLRGKTLTVRGRDGASATTLDAQQLGRVVAAQSGEGPGTRVEGLTLRNGVAQRGGGVLVNGASLELVDCVVEDCIARADGGGVAGPAALLGCIVRGNTAGGPLSPGRGGGAIGARLEDCELVSNHAWERGGAAEDCQLLDCTTSANRVSAAAGVTELQGGALWGCHAEDTLVRVPAMGSGVAFAGLGAAYCTLERCIIRDGRIWDTNFVRGAGCYECDLVDCDVIGFQVSGGYGHAGAGVYGGTALRCRIARNENGFVFQMGPDTSPRGGGAAAAQLERCVLYENRSEHGAAAWSCELLHCTVWSNEGRSLVSALRTTLYPGLLVTRIENSVVRSPGETHETLLEGTRFAVRYSDVEGGWPGPGNFDAEPEFWRSDAFNPDVHLTADSPCRDAGDPAAQLDPDGTRTDIGAFTFDPDHCGGAQVLRYCVAKTTSAGRTPRLEADGSIDLGGPDDLALRARLLPPDTIAFLVPSQDAARTPLLGGIGCVGPPMSRPFVGVADAAGEVVFPMPHARLAGLGIDGGHRVRFQCWFRDVAQTDGTGAGLTDGLRLTFCR